MQTLEAAYIFPVIFLLTGSFIIFSFRYYDAAISETAQYSMLLEQSQSLEIQQYSPPAGCSKSRISDKINSLYIMSEKPSISACLSGDCLYIQDNTKKQPHVFLSNFERCEILRKEKALLTALPSQ